VKKEINIKIGGKAGEGVKITGLILTKTLSRSGYSTFAYQEYPSLIRGGHNIYQVHASSETAFSQLKKIDILIALNQETVTLHQEELTEDSLILYDPAEFKLPNRKLIGKYISIKLIELAEKVGGKAIMANMVSLGAVLTLLGLPIGTLKKVIAKTFSQKDKKITELNQKAVEAGKKFIKDNNLTSSCVIAPPDIRLKNKRMIITGNEAVALGAVAAGLKFYSAYPMTPATSILHYLAAAAEKYNIVVKQPEDEIGAINQALGASFAGVRAMTATSGGGFCLMTEGLGLSGITETPIVIINSVRPGPATGMPTWSGQGDLKFMIYASQDEFPRVVLAPGDAEECFELTKKAFYLAEKYQLPVIILLDKNISESYYSNLPFAATNLNKRFSFTRPKNNFLRYKITETGISSRCFLGEKNGAHLCNSYEHDEAGLVTEESDQRIVMADKRRRKFETLKQEMLTPKVFGPKKAKTSLISWGSNKGPVLETLKRLKALNGSRKTLNYLHLNWLWPFPAKQVKEFIKSAQKVICLECNSTGQLASLIKEYTGVKVKKLLKYDGRPFYPGEIVKLLNG